MVGNSDYKLPYASSGSLSAKWQICSASGYQYWNDFGSIFFWYCPVSAGLLLGRSLRGCPPTCVIIFGACDASGN